MSLYGSIRYAAAKYREGTVCANCGKVFACPVETRYRVGSRQGDRYFCSWNCFRTVDKPKEERRRRAYERDTSMLDEEMRKNAVKQHRYYLNQKLKTSREKVEYYYHLRNGCKKGTPEYEHAQKMLTQWRKRRSDVLKELEEAK